MEENPFCLRLDKHESRKDQHLPVQRRGDLHRVGHLKKKYDIQKWKGEQARLREKMRIEPLTELPRFIAGADCAYSKIHDRAYAVAVVYDRVEQKIVEQSEACLACQIPYIPTFLSFREAPVLIRAIKRLKHPFGAIMFDGQGYSHPRRCGLAAHVGVTLDVPSIGVAKSILIGEGDDPKPKAGSFSNLIHKDEIVGEILRTCTNVNPVYISIGHRVDLESARKLVLSCVTKYRLPEPTRIADHEVGILKLRSPHG